MDCSPPGSSAHGDSPGKNTGVPCHAPLQGIFPTQGSNSGLPHCRWIPCPPPGDIPNPGIKLKSPTLQVDSLPSKPPGKPMAAEIHLFAGLIAIYLHFWTIFLLRARTVFGCSALSGAPYKVSRTWLALKNHLWERNAQMTHEEIQAEKKA